jgi:hypothetical protein
MKYRGWAEPDSHWLENFICGALGGAMGFFNFPGWLLVYFGWASATFTLLLCTAVGLAFGGWLAYEGKKETTKKNQRTKPLDLQ